MKLKHIICAIGMLMACIGHASAGPGDNTVAETSESRAIQIFTGKAHDNIGRISMKCSIARCDTSVILRARILNRSLAVHVVKPGLGLTLDNGESVTLMPERKSACCGDWAAGRWNNVSFRLSRHDIGVLKQHNVVSITIPTGKEKDIIIDIAPGKQNAIARLIRDIE